MELVGKDQRNAAIYADTFMMKGLYFAAQFVMASKK